MRNLLDWEGLVSWVTPTEEFFAVNHYNWPVVDEQALGHAVALARRAPALSAFCAASQDTRPAVAQAGACRGLLRLELTGR